jgi:hypothetical protein
LNRHCGPVEPVSDWPVRASLSPAIFSVAQHLFDQSQVCHLPFCRVAPFSLSRSIFFVCPVASPLPCQRASKFFSDRSFTLLGRAFFLFVCVSGALLFPVLSLLPAARATFACRHALSGHFPGAQCFVFFSCCRSLSGHIPLRRAQCFVFFLLPLCRQQRPCAVSSTPDERAEIFFWCACRSEAPLPCPIFSPAARSVPFCLLPLLCAPFFLSIACTRSGESFSGYACRVRSFLVCVHNFFCCPVNSRDAHANFFLFCSVRSPLLCSARADFSWTFLLCPRTSHACVSGAPNFFSCPVTSSSCANLNFFFLCCFWFSDHTGQNQLNWPLGAVELVLRTSSAAYIYLTSPPLLPLHSLSPWSLHNL